MPAPKGKKFPQRKPKKGSLSTWDLCKNDKRVKYTREEKAMIAMDYAITGSATATGKTYNVHPSTIKSWRKTEWWAELQAEIADQFEDKIRAKMNSVIQKSMDVTLERLEKGNVIIDKANKERRVPVNARDAMVIGSIGYDKRRISLNLPTSIQGASSSKQLEDLANQFKKLAQNFEYKQIRQNESIESTCEDEAVIDGETA